MLKYLKAGARIFAADMQVHRSIHELPPFKNAVITIGTFDGVHEGHKKIISALKNEAKACRGESVIITFHPHPRKIVQHDAALQLINTLEEKIELLQSQGIDHLVIVPFTTEFSEQSAEDYIERFLVQNFHPAVIIIGYDHHFGKGRTGNLALLQQYAAKWSYRLIEIPRHVLDEIGISSTQIRNALLESDVETANRLLGYPFYFKGTVVQGDQLGRQLGYPTANLEYDDEEKIRLGHGVFAVYVHMGEAVKKGMLSIGNRPTLTNSAEKVEVHIFNFDGQLYGQTLRVEVKKFLRAQEKYNSLEDLVEQLKKDEAESRSVL
jgi:riboflavin kinase/FMN adenylyltransferase